MMGTMVRVMRFQSSVRWMGITGWMFRSQTLRFSGPVLKLKLFWNGALMRSATGFYVFFARSELLSLSPLEGAAVCSARTGLARSSVIARRRSTRRLGSPVVFALHLPPACHGENSRGKARPPHEATCEVGLIGIAEIERDVGDLPGGSRARSPVMVSSASTKAVDQVWPRDRSPSLLLRLPAVPPVMPNHGSARARRMFTKPTPSTSLRLARVRRDVVPA